MCFITKELNILRAEQDIEVYKLFEGGDRLNTLYRNFPYVEDELFKADIKESESDTVLPTSEKEGDWLVEQYPLLRIDWNKMAYTKDSLPGLIVLSEGLHSFDSLEHSEVVRNYQDLQPRDTVAIRRCIIPAGSLYTINQFGSVISNQIIVKEIVNVELEKQN